MIAALIGAAILWAVLSPTAALVLGRAIRLADERESTQTPPAAVSAGKASTRSRSAHLRLVP
jgi:hypothetical protein